MDQFALFLTHWAFMACIVKKQEQMDAKHEELRAAFESHRQESLMTEKRLENRLDISENRLENLREEIKVEMKVEMKVEVKESEERMEKRLQEFRAEVLSRLERVQGSYKEIVKRTCAILAETGIDTDMVQKAIRLATLAVEPYLVY